jgi:drug/metabolite transporter (DMT)-like permease
MDPLTKYVSLLAAISIAAERLVEIVKGLCPWLAKPKDDPRMELRRKAALQILAAIAGTVTAYLASQIEDSPVPDSWGAFVVLGVMSSGGSGLWNALLGYLKAIKDIKQDQVTATRQALAAARASNTPVGN